MSSISNNNRTRKYIAWLLLFLVVACLMVIVICNLAVTNAAKGRMYTDPNIIPAKPVALLLGTSPIGRSGNPNQFFIHRIDATVKLYHGRKFCRLIISGANRPEDFNEPEEMRAALVSQGVPDSIMELDGEGFRTINSIVRAKDVYGADSILIISQEFHNERALFLAQHIGIDAVAFNAATTSSLRWRIQMKIREYFARVKAVLDLLWP